MKKQKREDNMSLNNANDTEKYIKSLTPERKALLDRGFDMINEKYGKTLDALAGNDVDFDDLDELGQMSKSE